MEIIKDIEPDKVWELHQAGALLLDVRGKVETLLGTIENSLVIPHKQVPNRLSELEDYRDKTIIVYCAIGGRSQMIQEFLIAQGFSEVINGGSYSEIKNASKS